MDLVAKKLASYDWPYAENDFEALHAILRKIEIWSSLVYGKLIRRLLF